MAIEFMRMKLRRKSAPPLLLSGGAVLQLDGAIDLLGDAMVHAETVGALIDGVDAGAAPTPLPLAEVMESSCRACPVAARSGAGCRCLQVDRLRMDGAESLSPVLLRPGQPPAVAGEQPRGLWQAFAAVRAARARQVRRAA
ncbi:hypothetical protein [Azospirillum thermophilum]|nr:hypothetical protein [Azospirillum thermophilum]